MLHHQEPSIKALVQKSLTKKHRKYPADHRIVCSVIDLDLVEKLEFFAHQNHICSRGKLSLSKAVGRILDENIPPLEAENFQRDEILPADPISGELRRLERVSSCVPFELVERLDQECARRGVENRSHMIFLILSERLRGKARNKQEADQIAKHRPVLTRQRVSK